jgi:hypothetical protein
MVICYLCGNIIDEKSKSKEHIIQNALGGKLKSYEILCKECNGELNKKIDVDFLKIMAPIYTNVELETDREINPSVHGYDLLNNLEIIRKNRNYVSKKPKYYPEKNLLFCPKNQEKNYKNYISDNYPDVNINNIKVVNNIESLFAMEFELNDNEKFKKGIVKIALGYAYYSSVEREKLIHVIDEEEKDIVTKDINFIAYLPKNYCNDNFTPTHILGLYGSKKENILYCYVELFGVFKFYIILNSIYDGDDIKESYIYDFDESKEIAHSQFISDNPINMFFRNKNEMTELILETQVNFTKCQEYGHKKFYQFENYSFRIT